MVLGSGQEHLGYCAVSEATPDLCLRRDEMDGPSDAAGDIQAG
jgi:hypothetical protein